MFEILPMVDFVTIGRIFLVEVFEVLKRT